MAAKEMNVFDPKKPIQWGCNGEWFAAEYVCPHKGKTDYHWLMIPHLDDERPLSACKDHIRNTPEPEWVPFTAETFPPLNQVELRWNGRNDCRGLAQLLVPDGLKTIFVREDGSCRTDRKTWAELLAGFEIRINGGPWQKCGIRKS